MAVGVSGFAKDSSSSDSSSSGGGTTRFGAAACDNEPPVVVAVACRSRRCTDCTKRRLSLCAGAAYAACSFGSISKNLKSSKEGGGRRGATARLRLSSGGSSRAVGSGGTARFLLLLGGVSSGASNTPLVDLEGGCSSCYRSKSCERWRLRSRRLLGIVAAVCIIIAPPCHFLVGSVVVWVVVVPAVQELFPVLDVAQELFLVFGSGESEAPSPVSATTSLHACLYDFEDLTQNSGWTVRWQIEFS